MRSAANTWARIASTSGISVAAAAPTQSASVETSSSTPLPCIGGALAGERQVQAVFAEQDMGEQERPGTPAGDRVRGRRRLRDRLAGAAGRVNDAPAWQIGGNVLNPPVRHVSIPVNTHMNHTLT